MQLGVSRDIRWKARLLPGVIHIICGPGARARRASFPRSCQPDAEDCINCRPRQPLERWANHTNSPTASARPDRARRGSEWRESIIRAPSTFRTPKSRPPPPRLVKCSKAPCIMPLENDPFRGKEDEEFAPHHSAPPPGGSGARRGGGGRYDVVRTLRLPPEGAFFLRKGVHRWNDGQTLDFPWTPSAHLRPRFQASARQEDTASPAPSGRFRERCGRWRRRAACCFGAALHRRSPRRRCQRPPRCPPLGSIIPSRVLQNVFNALCVTHKKIRHGIGHVQCIRFTAPREPCPTAPTGAERTSQMA
eukprot:gene25156-biopygen16480